MYHTIEFVTELMVDFEGSRKDRLERLRLHKGARVQPQIKPYVLETADACSKWPTSFSRTAPPPARSPLRASLLWISNSRERGLDSRSLKVPE
jgi:hypothetical protein